MSKILAVLAAALFAAGAYAQTSAAGGTPQDVPTNTKPQLAAQAKDNAKPQGKVAKSNDQFAKTAEGGAIGTGKAAMAGEKRRQARIASHSGQKPTPQGGTPK